MGTIVGKRSDDGVQLMSLTPYAYSATDHSRYKGFLYTCTAGQTTTFDHLLDAAVRLRGGTYWVTGSASGDHLTFQVVDKDNVLGMGAGAVVAEYVSTMYVPPWDHRAEIDSPTAALLNAGLYLRVIYTSNGTSDVALGITYAWFIQTS